MSATFTILRRNERDIIKNVYRSSCKVPLYCCQILIKIEFNLQVIFRGQNFDKSISKPMKIHPVRAELYSTRTDGHTDGKTDRQTTDRYDEANSQFPQLCGRA